MSRKPDDHDGHVIDAAVEVHEDLQTLQASLLHDGHVPDDGGAKLVHMVVVTWVDEMAEAGLLSRDAHHLDIIEKSLAELSARVQYETEKRGG